MRIFKNIFNKKNSSQNSNWKKCNNCNELINHDKILCDDCTRKHHDEVLNFAESSLEILKKELASYIVEINKDIDDWYNYEIKLESNHIRFSLCIRDEVDLVFRDYNSPNHSHLSDLYNSDEKLITYVKQLLEGEHLFYDVLSNNKWLMSAEI